jgi:hypothetical protein
VYGFKHIKSYLPVDHLNHRLQIYLDWLELVESGHLCLARYANHYHYMKQQGLARLAASEEREVASAVKKSICRPSALAVRNAEAYGLLDAGNAFFSGNEIICYGQEAAARLLLSYSIKDSQALISALQLDRCIGENRYSHQPGGTDAILLLADACHSVERISRATGTSARHVFAVLYISKFRAAAAQ